MARVAVHFLIPYFEDKSLGQGKKHSALQFRSLERELEVRFGGWTVLNAAVEGAWIAPDGKRIKDTSKEYVVDVEEERLDEVRELMAQVAVSFSQQCIRVVIRGEVEYIDGEFDDENS